MKIGIIGSGSFALALSLVLNDNNHKVTLWNRTKDSLDSLIKYRKNEKYLKGTEIPNEINFTWDKEEIITTNEIILVATPSSAVRENLNWIKNYINPNQILINASKGFDEEKNLRLSQVIEEILPNTKFAIFSGPGHAEEIAKKMPTALVASSKDLITRQLTQDIFMNEYIRLYTSDDIIGVELGGALKNVIAIGVGILEGANLGDNAKASFMTRGNLEITELGIKMGANRHTFSGLSGVGDLIVTCGSMHSRNRRAGIMLGQGHTLEETLKEINMVVEGVKSAKTAFTLGQQHKIELPIINEVYKVIFQGKNTNDSLRDLMSRNKKDEFLI